MSSDREPIRFRRSIGICALIVAFSGLVSLLGWAVERPILASLGPDMIPVAPSSAVFFVFFAITIFLRTLDRESSATKWLGIAVHAVGAVIALSLLVSSLLDLQPEIEHLGFAIVNIPGAVPIGHMSPVTAICLLLASLSYLLSLPSTQGRRRLAVIAWGLACGIIATGLTLALAYLYGTPMLYGGAFVPPAALTSMAIIALGGAMLALSTPAAWPPHPDLESTTRSSYILLLVFVILAAGIVLAGFLYYRNYEVRHRTEVERQLVAIADLKVESILHWRQERLGDAALFYGNMNFAALVRRFFQNPEDVEAEQRLRTWLQQIQKSYQYDRIILLDAAGQERMAAPEARRPISSHLLRRAAAALRARQVAFEDFYRNDIDGRIYLAVLIPILREPDLDQAVGTLILRIDPEEYFYPLISRWPTPSHTAETLLVRRENDTVLFLNTLRFQGDAALNLRRSLDLIKLPAAQAVLGRKGIMEGIDYRNVPVIADLRPVPDTPWYLVSRMDISEIYEPMREKLWTMVVLIASLLIGAGGGVGLVWRRQSSDFYREKFRASEALLESEERYRILVEGVKDYAIIMLDPEGNVMSWNQGAERIKGYLGEEIIGRHFSRFYLEDDVRNGKPQRELQRAAETGRFEDEGWRVRKDGSVYWASVVISALRDEVGQLRGFSKITRDITERKRMDDKLRETLTDLQRSNRELEQFAYVASHDLQEPLRMVSSYTQLLAERYQGQLDDKADKFIRYAVDGAVRMQLLINDLLAYSRIGSKGKPLEPVAGVTVVKEALGNLKLNIEEAQALITTDELPTVRGDASQLVLLMQNLIGNAIKFRSAQAPLIHIEARDLGGEWLFAVHDNGIGIETQYAEKIFVIFQRLHAKEEYPGSGIGLAICKKIVERHGGRIWFESAAGKGTTFYFTLPK